MSPVVSVRYIVDDVDAGIAFHTGLLLEDPAGNLVELFEPPQS
jgi:hypothetical protein